MQVLSKNKKIPRFLLSFSLSLFLSQFHSTKKIGTIEIELHLQKLEPTTPTTIIITISESGLLLLLLGTAAAKINIPHKYADL